jgi:hypothetical protein
MLSCAQPFAVERFGAMVVGGVGGITNNIADDVYEKASNAATIMYAFIICVKKLNGYNVKPRM